MKDNLGNFGNIRCRYTSIIAYRIAKSSDTKLCTSVQNIVHGDIVPLDNVQEYHI